MAVDTHLSQCVREHEERAHWRVSAHCHRASGQAAQVKGGRQRIDVTADDDTWSARRDDGAGDSAGRAKAKEGVAESAARAAAVKVGEHVAADEAICGR
jgi:hypothetical protein